MLDPKDVRNSNLRALLLRPVCEMGLDLKLSNALESVGIMTVNDLLHQTVEQLKAIHLVHDSCINTIFMALEDLGFVRGQPVLDYADGMPTPIGSKSGVSETSRSKTWGQQASPGHRVGSLGHERSRAHRPSKVAYKP